ncbi:MAG: autoinducer binding domain-containing protein [Gammaproteobacteria bacterium]
MRLEEFIELSNRAGCVDELFELFRRAVETIGIDQIVFSLMTDHAALNKRAGHGILVNYPEDWMSYYTEQGYETLDPVRHYMFAAAGPFEWRTLISNPALTNKQKTFFNQAADAGLRTGFGIPLLGPRGALAGFGLASSAPDLDLDRNALSYINLLAQQFYQVYLTLEGPPRMDDPVYMTEREKEILKWSANGKTRGEIGAVLNISENTVDYHLRNVYRKLDTNNITVAVLNALRNGLIQL